VLFKIFDKENEDEKEPSKRQLNGRLKDFLRLDLNYLNSERSLEEINQDKTTPL